MSELNSVHTSSEARLENDWHVIAVKARVDSFNQEDLLKEIRACMSEGRKRIALDLKHNRFLSLPTIKGCVDAANELAKSGGSFALISCQERTKRHFEIYGSLDQIRVYRSDRELSA